MYKITLLIRNADKTRYEFDNVITYYHEEEFFTMNLYEGCDCMINKNDIVLIYIVKMEEKHDEKKKSNEE